MAATTTISISRETKELLRNMGRKGDSYDEIIRKLLREANGKAPDERWNTIVEDDEFIPLDAL
jgi:predicted CopG family antitoxin